MGTSYEEFQKSDTPPNVAPGNTCILYNDGEQLEASKAGSVYFPVSTPRFPEQFGGDFSRLAAYCQTAPRPLTIDITDDFVVPNDGGTPWSLGSVGSDVTFDCGETPRRMLFEDGAQVRLENFAALLGFSDIESTANSRGGFIGGSNPSPSLVIDGKAQTTLLQAVEGGAPLIDCKDSILNLYLRNAKMVDVGDWSNPPILFADANINLVLDQGSDIQQGTIKIPNVVPVELRTNYDVRNFDSFQNVTGMTTISSTLDTTYVTTDGLTILPTWKEIFIDSSTVGKIFLPLYPYDGEWFTITDAVDSTTFSGNPVNLKQGPSTALIQEFSGPTTFSPNVKLDRKGQSITYVYNATLNKWHVRSNFG